MKARKKRQADPYAEESSDGEEEETPGKYTIGFSLFSETLKTILWIFIWMGPSCLDAIIIVREFLES